MFYFHPYLGKWTSLTNIFQRGWNHQLDGGFMRKRRAIGHRRKFRIIMYCREDIIFRKRYFENKNINDFNKWYVWLHDVLIRLVYGIFFPDVPSLKAKHSLKTIGLSCPKRKFIFQPLIFRGNFLVSGSGYLDVSRPSPEHTWGIIPASKWSTTMVSKSPSWGGSPSQWPFHGL